MELELFDHYLRDRSRAGEPLPGSFTGAAGGTACGDFSRLSLLIEGGRIVAVTGEADGCGSTRAANAAAAELAEGRTVAEAAAIGSETVNQELGGLTVGKLHAADLAADSLHRALSVAAASGVSLAPVDQTTAGAPERVLVALSGGVDSAVAALVERERGAEVIAVTLKLWADPETDGSKACCSPEAVVGARRLSHQLGIPHLTLDLEGEFRRRVVGRFLAGYAEGQTPNPCVLCNGEVRIAAMVDLADRLGAASLITGHYARIEDDGQGPLLTAAADPAKDQGYMLAALPTEILARLRFPLAELRKPQVREIAAEHGLAVARKPESQDLCFLAGQGKREFLRRHAGLEDREGPIKDGSGRVLGRHRGHHHFTVGQRRGLGVASTEPYYVTATDAATNTVTVGREADLAAERIAIRDVTLHRAGEEVDSVRLRYRSGKVGARLSHGAEQPASTAPENGSLPAGHFDRLELSLERPFNGAAPGQAAVMMSGDRIVGHGTIAAGAGGAAPLDRRNLSAR